MKIKTGNVQTIFVDRRGYFEATVFEISKVDCYFHFFFAHTQGRNYGVSN